MWSSPRPWGCFSHRVATYHRDTVVPTPVGVFPLATPTCRWVSSRPHARGGVSTDFGARRSESWSSPRPWGCFLTCLQISASHRVVPTPVGVFLYILTDYHLGMSSPRPWGCFWRLRRIRVAQRVVPTPVGVFLSERYKRGKAKGRPHARGGVSNPATPERTTPRSSPRPWGCFSSSPIPGKLHFVVPTPVGVFLLQYAVVVFLACRPHARGGVSLPTSANSGPPSSSPRPWGCFRIQP